MKFEIKSRFTGAILFSFECASLKLCVESAVAAEADLCEADLRGADLRGADLCEADLRGADLRGADLCEANLCWANLRGADLCEANLCEANLCWANLRGADLRGADLRGADTDTPTATPKEAVANLDKVREIVLDNANLLEMEHWHQGDDWKEKTCAEVAVCGTTHCLAGWLQICSTDKVVRQMPPHLAGVVMAPVAAKHFYDSDEEVLQWLTDRAYATEAP